MEKAIRRFIIYILRLLLVLCIFTLFIEPVLSVLISLCMLPFLFLEWLFRKEGITFTITEERKKL